MSKLIDLDRLERYNGKIQEQVANILSPSFTFYNTTQPYIEDEVVSIDSQDAENFVDYIKTFVGDLTVSKVFDITIIFGDNSPYYGRLMISYDSDDDCVNFAFLDLDNNTYSNYLIYGNIYYYMSTQEFGKCNFLLSKNNNLKVSTKMNVYESLGIEEYQKKSYNVGDIVYNGTTIYRCIIPEVSHGSMDPNNWEVITIMDYLRESLNIPSTGVSESTNTDIDSLFTNGGGE